MWLLLTWLACGSAPPVAPPTPLDAPWSEFADAARGAKVKASTDKKLVLVYANDQEGARVVQPFLEHLRADGWGVDDGTSLGRGIVSWTASRDGAELMLSVVPQPDRLEVHLNY